jgi:hypothetical protein
MSRQLQPRLSDDGLDAFLHIPAPQPAPPHPQHTGQRDNVAVPSSSILSPQPHIKKQLLDDHSQSPPAERSSAATNNVEHHRHSRVDMHPQLQHSPNFNTGRSGGDVNEGEGDDDDDLARSEAERGQLKDIVLKFHRNRHALLSPPQDDDDFTSLPPMGLSAATPNRNTAPSPYPYQRDELLGSGGGVGVGGLAGDITMSPTPREAPKVCLSPYKRATLVYSGQHIHSSVSTSSSSSSSSTPSGSSSAVPTRKSLFNSGDALGTLGVSSSGVPSRHGHGIELGLLPSSSSPPLPMQREIVDKVKVALDEAVQSVKSRIIEVLAPTLWCACACACACGACHRIVPCATERHVDDLFGAPGTTVQLGSATTTQHATQPLPRHAQLPATRDHLYPFSRRTSYPVILLTLSRTPASPTAMPQASYQRYEEPGGADQGTRSSSS